MKLRVAIISIVIAGVISACLSTIGLAFGAMELGTLNYVFIPLAVTSLSLLILLIISLFWPPIPAPLVWAFVIIVISIGIILRIDFYHHFLPF